MYAAFLMFFVFDYLLAFLIQFVFPSLLDIYGISCAFVYCVSS